MFSALQCGRTPCGAQSEATERSVLLTFRNLTGVTTAAPFDWLI